MKKVVSVLSILLLVIVLSGCSKDKVVNGITFKTVDLNNLVNHKTGDLNYKLPSDYEIDKANSGPVDDDNDLIMDFYNLPIEEKVQYDLDSCSFTIKKAPIYDDSIEEDIKDQYSGEVTSNYYNQDYKINKKTINDREWTYVEVESEIEEGYVSEITGYYIDYNNSRYSFEFENYYPEGTDCSKMFSNAVNSLSFDK